jgi:hypothetical protein
LVVDGVQGGTWPQVHLLGTAALERYTGYTAQSRGRHATHTWNVTRLPEVDHGGVLADQRTPGKEVLDAMRRVPDTAFAIHDAPSRVEQLLDEQSRLRFLLRQRPPNVAPALHQAELALGYAQKELYWAHHRVQHAEERLHRLGRLSHLRRSGRNDKSSTLEDIDRFTGDVQRAEAKVARCREELDELRDGRNRRAEWDAEYDWPSERLRTVEAELTSLTRPAQRLDPDQRTHLTERNLNAEHPWLDRLAEVAPPPLPGPDRGIDLGL